MEEVFTLEGNNLKIKDGPKFISMFYGDDEDSKTAHKILSDFAFRQKNKIAPELNGEEYSQIVNFSIMKAIKDFKEEKGAQLNSYFFVKIRGEVKHFRDKRDALQRKVIKVINEDEGEGVSYEYQKGSGDDGANSLEKVDNLHADDRIIKEDRNYRQIKSFKIAFSGIPKEMQYVLHAIADGKKIAFIAAEFGVDEYKIQEIRNGGLSLILQRVMRGRHLDEEEKREVAELHGIDYEEGEFDTSRQVTDGSTE